jgi:hypothetical protein
MSTPIDTLNQQMNTLVESQASLILDYTQEIKDLKELLYDAVSVARIQDNQIKDLKEENKELNYRIDALSKMNDKKHKYHKNKCEEVKKLKKAISELGVQNQYHKNGWEVFGCQSKKDLDDEINAVKEEMTTMYHIIMNDGDKYEISKDQPLLKMVQFNIGLMLEKFKEMGSIIQGTTHILTDL